MKGQRKNPEAAVIQKDLGGNSRGSSHTQGQREASGGSSHRKARRELPVAAGVEKGGKSSGDNKKKTRRIYE